jgi:hypothetical protein
MIKHIRIKLKSKQNEKKGYLALIVVLIFMSCSGVGDESNQSFDVKGTFEHTIRIVITWKLKIVRNNHIY